MVLVVLATQRRSYPSKFFKPTVRSMMVSLLLLLLLKLRISGIASLYNPILVNKF